MNIIPPDSEVGVSFDVSVSSVRSFNPPFKVRLYFDLDVDVKWTEPNPHRSWFRSSCRLDARSLGMMGARQLSQIKEESGSREHSTCFLPPIVPQQQKQQQIGRARKPGVDKVDRQEGRHLVVLHEHQRNLEDSNSLLDELGRIEAEIRLDVERQQEAESHRQRENMLLWQNLLYLSLSQRVTKPWISSYFRMFPMHIYCLPIQTVKGRRPGLKKRR